MISGWNDDLTPSTDISVSLEWSYNRLRRMRDQGRILTDVEFLLNLLRNLRVVKLDGITIKIPLIFAEEWELSSHDGYRRHLEKPAKEFCTTFAQSNGKGPKVASPEESISRLLVQRLNRYFKDFHYSKLLLDITKRPSYTVDPRWGGAGLSNDQSRGAFYSGTETDRHPLFKNLKMRLPSLLLETQTLIRLTFPLNHESQVPPFRMGTIILGLKIVHPPLKKLTLNNQLPEYLMSHLVGFARTLIAEVPIKYTNFHKETGDREPKKAEPKDRNELRQAVNHLHDQIAALAARKGLKGWRGEVPKNGNNFLIAFRELDENNLEGHLRYCLTHLNRVALASSLSPPEHWLAEARYITLEQKMFNLFSRTKSIKAPKTLSKKYAADCRKAMRRIINQNKGNGLAEEFSKELEKRPYPLRSTPGYHVMKLGYPEIVNDWLADPRACSFENYPPFLLAWETIAVPSETYYSPIADGDIPFGICGVKAELLDRGGGVELQQLIDDSAPKLRSIILDILIRNLGKGLFKAISQGTSGKSFWFDALWHFRQLAYYYLPDGNDYLTKLVKTTDLVNLNSDLKRAGTDWEWGGTLRWRYVRGGLNKKVAARLRAIAHQRISKSNDFAQRDFLGEYLGKRHDIGDASLFITTLSNQPDLSLIVLVPSPYHHQLASELIDRFTAATDAALIPSLTVVEASLREIGHEFVYLLPLLRAHTSRGATKELKLLIDVIEGEVHFFKTDYSSIAQGPPPITMKRFFQLMSTVQKVIRTGVASDIVIGGGLASVKAHNVLILRTAITEAKRSRSVKSLAARSLGISEGAALLLLWEISINLCKHAVSWVKFTVKPASGSRVLVTIESDRDLSPVDRAGRYGVEHLQKVTQVLNVDLTCGPAKENKRVYRSHFTFPGGV